MMCRSAFAAVIVLALFSSCRSQTQIRHSRTVADTLILKTIHRDSVYVRDSTVTGIRNDTVFVDRTHYIYKYRIMTDTLFRQKLDTVYSLVSEKNTPVLSGTSVRNTLFTAAILLAMILVLILAVRKT